MERSPGSGEVSPFNTDALVGLLDQHGVPERQRVSTLETALGISYGAARRRMTGETPWELPEVVRLAAYFKEPLLPLLSALVDEAGQPATACLGGMKIPCCIWPGPVSSQASRQGLFVAYRTEADERWTVVPATEAGDRPVSEVRRILYEASALPQIALLAGDEGLRGSATQALRTRGLDPVVYQDAQQLRRALQATRFDGFILEESVLASDLRPVLEEVRARNATGPVIVLTQPGEAEGEQDQALAAVVSDYGVQLYEKSARMLHLCSAVESGLRAAARGRR